MAFTITESKPYRTFLELFKSKYTAAHNKNKTELLKRLQMEWQKIPREFTKKFVDSMNKRRAAVIQQNINASKCFSVYYSIN